MMKFKEYWLQFDGESNLAVVFHPGEMNEFGGTHVIEYEAYALENQKRNEAVETASKFESENELLKAKLWVANDARLRTYDGLAQKADKYDEVVKQRDGLKEALKYYAEKEFWGKIAREALKTFGGEE